jgi:glycosyltransferase involved in cell wall biosynthesis
MRVLQAMAGAEHGGAEAFFTRLAGAFARRGVVQQVLVRPHAARRAALEAAGVPVVPVRFGGWLDRAIAEFRPDIVFTWMNRATRFRPARRAGERPYVHVGRLGGYYDLKYYRRCDHLVGNTVAIVDWLVAQGWPAARAHFVPNFVSAAPAPPVSRADLAVSDGRRIALALGRFHRNKGFDVLLTALAELPGVHLVLAGAGPEERALRAAAAGPGVAGRVTFLPWQQDVAPLFAAADVFVCPSRHEPLGNVVIEAWAQARPVVAAASAGPAALVVDGASGMLVPVDDAGALADGIRRVLADTGLAARIAAGGRAAYLDSFTEEAVVDRYLALFERLAAAGPVS